jgi:hypothetical protein
MIYTDMTKLAMRIAFNAHKEQTDKAGMPYIFHPFHLAEQMTDELSVCAALLHDVVEDTSVSFDDLAAQGISASVISVLKLLTHDSNMPYMDYIKKIKDSGNQPAIKVKLADLRHNSDLSRLSDIVANHNVIDVIDTVLDAIRENAENFDAVSLGQYAEKLAFESDDAELVKLGIGLLGLFNLTDDPEMQEQLITLGLYEEFTLYVVTAAQQWDNANNVIYRLARNIDGWGKIHTVERLEPETDEIRDWILRRGCENDVMDAYLGLECANKGGLIDALRKDEIDNDLFNSICVLMEALFDEGPAAGISEYEHAEEAVLLYLQHASIHAKSLKHLWHILNVPSNSDEDVRISEDAENIRDEITNRELWRTVILDALGKPEGENFFYAVNTARRLDMDIDISEKVFSAVMSDPIRRRMYIRGVYQKPEHARALTELLERVMPLDKMAAGMGDYIFATEYIDEHSANEEALIGLGKYPNLGESLVLAGLNSPVVRERNQVCGTLEEWSKALGQPISAVAPTLYEALKSIAVIEVNKDTKKRMLKLINAKS